MTTTSNTPQTEATTITEHELQQCERANATGRQPVVFIHGLWLLPSSCCSNTAVNSRRWWELHKECAQP